MNKYEAAIAEITNHAEHSLKTKLSADTAAIAIEALRAQAERDKMRCENCCDYNKQHCPISRCRNNDPKNGYRTPFEKQDFCSYFNTLISKENENG